MMGTNRIYSVHENYRQGNKGAQKLNKRYFKNDAYQKLRKNSGCVILLKSSMCESKTMGEERAVHISQASFPT